MDKLMFWLAASQGTAAHGQLEPNATWLRGFEIANKVYNFWRMSDLNFVNDQTMNLGSGYRPKLCGRTARSELRKTGASGRASPNRPALEGCQAESSAVS
eukprot:5014285-Amphidinium_carterae.2